MNLLLVEDEALIALNISESLRDSGYSVQHVLTGLEAVDVLEAGDTIKGVITDIKLGGQLNGWEVARRAREIMPDIPVIYITGDSGHEHTFQGVPDSVLIEKPFAVAQIITAISLLLNASPSRG
jgi:CheY-like chemotaxis protein